MEVLKIEVKRFPTGGVHVTSASGTGAPVIQGKAFGNQGQAASVFTDLSLDDIAEYINEPRQIHGVSEQKPFAVPNTPEVLNALGFNEVGRRL